MANNLEEVFLTSLECGERHFDDVFLYFHTQGIHVGRPTVYRIAEQLETSGRIKREEKVGDDRVWRHWYELIRREK